MIKKLHAQKDSRRAYACYALAACMTYAGSKPALSQENAAPELNNTVPVINSLPTAEPENIIPLTSPIGAILLSKQHPLLLRSDFSRVSDFVNQIYQSTQYQPIWFGENHSEKNLNDLISILNNASADGLNPANYDVDRLKGLIIEQNLDGNRIASHDVALTVSLVRYLHDLRQGQVDLRDIEYPVHIAPKPPIDVAGLLKKHLASQTLTELVTAFEPKNRQYQQLKKILTGLKPLHPQADLEEFKPGKVLRPGDRHPQMAVLRQHLKALKVLDESSNTEGNSYDNELVEAIKKLQEQQGLKADGHIGPATAALFNESSGEKTAQIELAMERARWIPDVTEGPMIVVNIPAFELWAFSSVDDQNPLNMKVVVGKSPDNQTPVLWEEMKYLEFMPYWNIPKTIFQKEILPKAANNEGYLASQEIELIRHQNSDEQGGGSYIRARQRPGKKNPLGRVKFVFPNTADVYLHDTPSRSAFSRSRRDLSHGCVRVSEPEQLAEFVLGDQQGWDKESIKQAMSAPKNRHVTLKRSVPVLFYYATTFVDHENQLHFYPDIYGQDEQLKKALSKVQAPTLVNSAASNQLAANKPAEISVRP